VSHEKEGEVVDDVDVNDNVDDDIDEQKV
jgi:hypothetical protein